MSTTSFPLLQNINDPADLRQLSRAACIQGRTWGYGRNGIWVSDGCRAEFRTY